MTHRCRYCGHPIEIPHLFSPMQQRVFEYVWNNPGCTGKEIADALYVQKTNAVYVHLWHINLGLKDTEYRLTNNKVALGNESYKTNRPCRYYIKSSGRIDTTIETKPPEGTHHGTV